jgi:hypothetical protein
MMQIRRIKAEIRARPMMFDLVPDALISGAE